MAPRAGFGPREAVGGALILRSEHLLARIDAGHGAELLDLVDLRSGRQLLGRVPFSAAAPRHGELDEDAWDASYRGGWQISLPNVGSPCTADGRRHGYHGVASVDPWRVTDLQSSHATLEWSGCDLRVERCFSLAGAELRVESQVRVARADPVPMVALEHCTLGLDLLDPEVALTLPRAAAYEVDAREGPIHPPADVTTWPLVRLRDGGQERADRWPIECSRSRWMVLHEVPEGAAEIHNARRGTGLALRWDAEALPHLHVWHESEGGGPTWHGRARILGVEPASVPHGLGLAKAIDAGQASWVAPGRPLGWWVGVRVICEG